MFLHIHQSVLDNLKRSPRGEFLTPVNGPAYKMHREAAAVPLPGIRFLWLI